MSYCRFGSNSDAYIYSNGEYLICESCKLKGGKTFATKRRSRMMSHVEEHIDKGHNIPTEAIDELTIEFVLGDDIVSTKHMN
jgi:hypothetical protein